MINQCGITYEVCVYIQWRQEPGVPLTSQKNNERFWQGSRQILGLVQWEMLWFGEDVHHHVVANIQYKQLQYI